MTGVHAASRNKTAAVRDTQWEPQVSLVVPLRQVMFSSWVCQFLTVGHAVQLRSCSIQLIIVRPQKQKRWIVRCKGPCVMQLRITARTESGDAYFVRAFFELVWNEALLEICQPWNFVIVIITHNTSNLCVLFKNKYNWANLRLVFRRRGLFGLIVKCIAYWWKCYDHLERNKHCGMFSIEGMVINEMCVY
jgi:hypothetical protein